MYMFAVIHSQMIGLKYSTDCEDYLYRHTGRSRTGLRHKHSRKKLANIAQIHASLFYSVREETMDTDHFNKTGAIAICACVVTLSDSKDMQPFRLILTRCRLLIIERPWAPACMGKKGHLPPGNVKKCFFAANVV